MYQHRDWSGNVLNQATSKIICVRRNYISHIKEMNNSINSAPLFFMKPNSALCSLHQPIVIPKEFGRVDYETEIAVMIGSTLKNASSTGQIKEAVSGFAVALDLTLRDVQNEMKENGWPWTKAKAFDDSCPISAFLPASHFPDWDKIHFSLHVNNEIKQKGRSSEMMHSIVDLIKYASQYFTLNKGDILLTGTPKGVGPFKIGDKIKVTLGQYEVDSCVI